MIASTDAVYYRDLFSMTPMEFQAVFIQQCFTCAINQHLMSVIDVLFIMRFCL